MKTDSEKIKTLLQEVSKSKQDIVVPEQQKIISKLFPVTKQGETLSPDLLQAKKIGEELTRDLINAMEKRPRYQEPNPAITSELTQQTGPGIFPLRTAQERKMSQEERERSQKEQAAKRDDNRPGT